MLTRLEIENYRSLRSVSVDLPAFSAMVGPNAAGKTNFADAIDFLSIVAKSGLPQAITAKGGYDNLCFRRARRAKGPVRFRLQIDNMDLPYDPDMREYRLTYEFAFRAAAPNIRTEILVAMESLLIERREEDTWELFLHLRKENEDVSIRHGTTDPAEKIAVHLGRLFQSGSGLSDPTELLILSQLRGLAPFSYLNDFIIGFRLFQVAPSEARRPASASGTKEMGRYGENLPAALDALRREHPQQFEQLLHFLQLAVPTVEKIKLQYGPTRELGLYLKEKGMSRDQYSSELSDGTLRAIALFLPIVDPRYTLVVIEEPENCIHPWVIRQFVEACRDSATSSGKQILLTTHSPVLVSKLYPEELFLADREDGQTSIRPATQVEESLEQVIQQGIIDLGSYWDSGAMKAVPVQPTLFEEASRED